ncbi:hypothetical protein L1987_06381 [Smallanthus sonchifolius]|uniref:Uncharacterized protein n=1 Tax=Smallanthus sonchifolius TaxID=185202 RepID=A0ACB9JY09_9ASTR|nr:hypothetical protein L1987_06381 [Smallanthus sonchifolius]
MVDGKECCVTGERDEGVLEKKDQVIKTMEEKRRNPMREIGLAMVSKSSYKIRGVDITEAITKDEELVWEYLFKEDGMMYKLYGKKKRKLETDDESKLGKDDDRKGKGKVRTDDESDAYPLVRLSDHEDYFDKDSAYKVKEIFVKYLEHVKHPKTDELNAARIKEVKIAWATTSNALDCVVFVMRHMEKYLEAKEEFNTGLSSNGPKKNKQLKILRKKYAAHILLCESNKLREKIQIEALGK